MFEIEQFLTQQSCLGCRGCCRFSRENSVWQPALLGQEIKAIREGNNHKDSLWQANRIRTLPFQDYYVCYFFDCDNNQCKIYNNRPLECRLYPFLLNKTNGITYLSVDLNCPFIKGAFNTKEFKQYVNYLVSFLSLPAVSFALKQNPHIFKDYSESEEIRNLATLIF